MWFVGSDWLTFDNLSLGPDAGLQGGNDGGRRADHIRVQRCTISLTAGNPATGINATGDDWTIAGNTVANTGNSGMLLSGDSYTILGNTIDRTGLDSALDYGKHGIYLKVSHANVTRNTITDFSSDGISARYRDSTTPTTGSPTDRSGSRSSNTTNSPAPATGARTRSPAPPPPGSTCRRRTRPVRRSRAS